MTSRVDRDLLALPLGDDPANDIDQEPVEPTEILAVRIADDDDGYEIIGGGGSVSLDDLIGPPARGESAEAQATRNSAPKDSAFRSST